MKPIKALLCTSVLLSLLTGCANWTPAVNHAEVPNGNEAYLYGKFKINAQQFPLAIAGHNSMGFVFTCSDSKSYRVRFGVDQPIQLLKITPANCSLTEIIYTDVDGVIRGRKPSPDKMLKNLDFKAGKAYYIGDFNAAVSKKYTDKSVATNWSLKDMRNDFSTTTYEMKKLFPGMVDIGVVDVFQ